ncbi:MAG: hypothetical protein AAF333_10320 [Planctomycetota bacterium]
MTRTLLTLAGVATLALTGPPGLTVNPTLSAQDVIDQGVTPAPSLIPAEAVWGVVFDPAKIRDSALARQTLDRLDPAQRDGLNQKLDGLSNTLGINLRQDLGRVAAFGHGFNPQDMALAVDIGQAEANLEGLILAAPGYDSYEYNELIIHSLQESAEEPRLHCAVVPGGDDRNGVVIVSPAAQLTEGLVDQAQQGTAVADPATLGQDEFLRVWIDKLPAEMFGPESQQSKVLSMIQSIELVGTTNAEQTAMSLSITTANPARARQIYQMAAGGKAFIEFAATEDPDAAKLADLLAYITIDNPDGGAVVSIRAAAGTDDLAVLLDLLDEQGAFDELAQ